VARLSRITVTLTALLGDAEQRNEHD